MTSIDHVILEADDPAAARSFYDAAFGAGLPIDVRGTDAPTSGFRAYTLSLIVPGPSDVDRLLEAALTAGATRLKPAARSMWGYGGVVQAPDGAIWKIATRTRRDDGTPTGRIDQVVLLLGVEDVPAAKRRYAERGFEVGKTFMRSYVEFKAEQGAVQLGLLRRGALARDAGVAAEGSGSRRLAIAVDTEPFDDPDGFVWEAARARAGAPA
jgi:hypothetical protein